MVQSSAVTVSLITGASPCKQVRLSARKILFAVVAVSPISGASPGKPVRQSAAKLLFDCLLPCHHQYRWGVSGRPPCGGFGLTKYRCILCHPLATSLSSLLHRLSCFFYKNISGSAFAVQFNLIRTSLKSVICGGSCFGFGIKEIFVPDAGGYFAHYLKHNSFPFVDAFGVGCFVWLFCGVHPYYNAYFYICNTFFYILPTN